MNSPSNALPTGYFPIPAGFQRLSNGLPTCFQRFQRPGAHSPSLTGKGPLVGPLLFREGFGRSAARLDDSAMIEVGRESVQGERTHKTINDFDVSSSVMRHGSSMAVRLKKLRHLPRRINVEHCQDPVAMVSRKEDRIVRVAKAVTIEIDEALSFTELLLQTVHQHAKAIVWQKELKLGHWRSSSCSPSAI